MQVRGDEKWLPAKFAALQELSLRGRPRCFMVPPSCTNLSLAYHVSNKSLWRASALVMFSRLFCRGLC